MLATPTYRGYGLGKWWTAIPQMPGSMGELCIMFRLNYRHYYRRFWAMARLVRCGPRSSVSFARSNSERLESVTLLSPHARELRCWALEVRAVWGVREGEGDEDGDAGMGQVLGVVS